VTNQSTGLAGLGWPL